MVSNRQDSLRLDVEVDERKVSRDRRLNEIGLAVRLDCLELPRVHVLPVLLAMIVVLLDPVVNAMIGFKTCERVYLQVRPRFLEHGVIEPRKVPLVCLRPLEVKVQEALARRTRDPLV